jgi:hypothetical protein
MLAAVEERIAQTLAYGHRISNADGAALRSLYGEGDLQ